MNENKTKMYTGLLKVQRSNKSRSKVFRGPSVLVSRAIACSRGSGRGWGAPYDSLMTCWFFKYMIGQRFHYTLKTDLKNHPKILKKLLIEPRTPTKLSHFLIE